MRKKLYLNVQNVKMNGFHQLIIFKEVKQNLAAEVLEDGVEVNGLIFQKHLNCIE